MSDKKEEKSGWFSNVARKFKMFVPSFLLMLSSCGAEAAGEPPSLKESQSDTFKSGMVTDSVNTDIPDNRLAEVKKQLDGYSSKVYKGLKIDLANIKPQEVAHIFESGMNPCVTDGNKPLSTASYLGLCQMDLRGTLQNFVKQSADEFPELQTAVKKYGIRSSAFMAAWKKYSYGPEAKKFEQKQFDYMWDIYYRKIFDNLAATGDFPKITEENYANAENFIYSAAVISCANQSPRGTVGIFQQARKALGPQATIADIALKTYDIKTARWGLKTRYREESRLLKDKKQQLRLADLYQSLEQERMLAASFELVPAGNPAIAGFTRPLSQQRKGKVAVSRISRRGKHVTQGQTLNLALLMRERSHG